MRKVMSIIYGVAAITALTIGLFTFQSSTFVGSLFVVMALAFAVVAFIITTTQED